ncbi:MAG: hypothetical protein VZQ98_16820 [Bacteroidales bacterium]|nr:hypothetical protein [Bacteroidales bacterium]
MRELKKCHIYLFRVAAYLVLYLILVCIAVVVYLVIIPSLLKAFPLLDKFIEGIGSDYLKEVVRIVLSLVLTAVIPAIFRPILQIRKSKRMVSKMYDHLRRSYNMSRHPLVCLMIENFINVLYRGDFLSLESQMTICNEVLDHLEQMAGDNNLPKKNYLIQGDAHSGKSTLICKLITEIFSSEKCIPLLKGYNKNVYLYDFSYIEQDSNDILALYDNRSYKNHIIIFDNLQKLKPKKLCKLISKITMNPGKALCVIMFSRNIDCMLDTDSANSIQKSCEKGTLVRYSLSQISYRDSYDDDSELNEYLLQYKFDSLMLSDGRILFNLYHVYSLNNQTKRVFTDRFLRALGERSIDSPILLSFVFICCESAFTGTIDRKIYKEFKKSHRNTPGLRKYVRSGVIQELMCGRKREYLFHEMVAKAYLKYLCRDESIKNACKSFFSVLYETASDENRYKYSLLTSTERSKEDLLKMLDFGHFDEAMGDIDYITSVFSIDQKEIAFDKAILLDRKGEFLESKKLVVDYYDRTGDGVALIFLLHADHKMLYDPKYIDKYKGLCHSKNPYLRASSRYWHSHILMHAGVFVGFADIDENQISDIVSHSYEGLHFLRRYYFDNLRMYYLIGTGDENDFWNILDKIAPIRRRLIGSLKEYNYYEMKFSFGHYLQYELIPKMIIYGEPPSQKSLDYVNCQESDMKTVAMKYYHQAYEFFKENDDKTADYVMLRMCELDPSYVLKSFYNMERKDLVEFDKAYFDRIVYVFDSFRDQRGDGEEVYEYSAFAETFKMKFVMICKMNCSLEIDYNSIISESAENAKKYHKMFIPNHPNEYGLLRIDLLLTIDKFITDQDAEKYQQKLLVIHEMAEKKGYHREVRLIEALLNKHETGFIRKVITYYPIVLQ